MKIRKIIEDPGQDYFTRLAYVESSNNPLAKAKTSSAAGLFQFTEGTWKGLTEQLGLNYNLDDRFDPKKSREVVEEFTKQNERYLKNKLGRTPNNAELYLAHFSGMGGANKLLKSLESNPDINVGKVFKENQIKANKNVFLNKDGSEKTVKDIYNWAAKKFNVPEIQISENNSVNQKGKSSNREFFSSIVDNTQVRKTKIPDLATPPINSEGNLKNNTDKINSVNEVTKQRYSNLFSSPENIDENGFSPQPYEEDLSHLYNYIKLTD